MTTETERRTRRTEGIHTRGRAMRVVESVLRAALEELGRVGYAGLRYEDVAARSGVNKTTIYRRWPTKSELVSAALRDGQEHGEPVDTGSLRGDLMEDLRRTVARTRSLLGQGIIRMLQVERADPEVEAITRRLREEKRQARLGLVERAMGRGELPEGTSAELVLEVIFSPIHARLMQRGEDVPDEFLVAVVDLVLRGAGYGRGVG